MFLLFPRKFSITWYNTYTLHPQDYIIFCVIFPVSHLCCVNCSLNYFLRVIPFKKDSIQCYFWIGLVSFFSFGWKVSAVGVILNIRNKLTTDWQELSARTDPLFSLWQLVSSKARPGVSSKLYSQPGNSPRGAAAPALSLPVRLPAMDFLNTF